MAQTEQQILESIRALPEPVRHRLLATAESEIRRSVRSNGATQEEIDDRNERFRKALNWVEDHRSEYDGQFVALDGDDLVASGTDSNLVFQQAKAKGYKSPFLKRIKADCSVNLPFGGW